MKFLGSLAQAIDRLNQSVGETVSWLALFMVLVQFIVVVLRYVFGVGSIFMQESILYMHGTLFMVGAGYTLLHNGHVRVDVFYREAHPRTQAKVDLFGAIVFLIPVCTAIAIYSWGYVANSWATMEGSAETSGIQARFLLKSTILVFCALMILQGISMICHGIRVLAGVETPGADGDVHEHGHGGA